MFQFIVFLVFAGLASRANGCVYYICTESFLPWSPKLGQGECRWQITQPTTSVRAYFGSPPCPRSVPCQLKPKARAACNCREVQQCRWAAWGSWTGTIPDGSCRTQSRTRLAQATYKYREIVGGCGSVVSSCPRNDETEQRTRCRCRKADVCALSPWTAWAGNIPNGGCATQTSVQPVTPHYIYIEQVNCNMIRSTCDPPRSRTRSKCLCETKDCTLQQWSGWSVIPGRSSSCPIEARERDYTFVTRYIDAVNDCKNIGVKRCPPKERQQQPKVVRCPKINAPPYGRLLDTACNGVNSSCHSACTFACNNGFERRGKAYLRCMGNGQWDGTPPICHDVTNPTITCPKPMSYPNEPGKNYANINVPQATAYDLVAIASLTSNASSPLKLVVGAPVRVKYTAEDAAGNTASCTVVLKANDTEPPRVISCPDNIEKKTAASSKQVIWPEPVFHDNVEGNSVDRTPSLGNGQQFRKGVHHVLYVAEDKAGNKARCEFNITIADPDNLCPTYDEPKNGSLVCNNKMIQNTEMYVCGISCQNGYGFANFQNSMKVYNFYICSGDGNWYGSDISPKFPSQLAKLQKGRPWSDCSKNYPADAIIKHFTIMAGPCNANKTKDELKKEFKAKMKDDIMIKYLFCTRSQCDVTDIEVTCSRSRKRSVGTLRIEFDVITVPDLPTNQSTATFSAFSTFSSVQDLQRIEAMLRKQIEATIKRLQGYLQQLENQIKRIMAHLLKINEYLLRITSKPFEVGCPHGSTMSKVGNPPRKLCTKCPIGEMYDSKSKICIKCPKGSYQDREGRSHCIACPQGSTTLANGAATANYCRDICGPGTYSRAGHGLSTCMACRKGFYQPNSRQSACIACPNGKTTNKYGSVSAKDCN